MKKFYLLIVVIVLESSYVWSMDYFGSQEIVLSGKNNAQKRISSALVKPDKLDKFVFKDDKYHVTLPDADANDLYSIKKFFKIYGRVQFDKRVRRCNPDAIESEFYDYARGLSTKRLVFLAQQLGNFFSDNKIPYCLTRSLVERAQLMSSRDICTEELNDFSQLSLETKNAIAAHLLAETSGIEGEHQHQVHIENLITSLLTPYSQQLHASQYISSHFISPIPLLLRTIEQYAYVSDNITVSFVGSLVHSSPSCEYQLMIRTKKGVTKFTLQENADIDYKPNSTLVDNDESLIVCEYNDTIAANYKGLYIVDLTTGTSKKIKLPADDYVACCFGKNNEIYGINNNGVWRLDRHTEEFSPIDLQFYADFGSVKGIMQGKGKDDGKFIINTTKRGFFSATMYAQYAVLEQLSAKLFMAEDMIIDATGTKKCIKTFARSNGSSNPDFFLYCNGCEFDLWFITQKKFAPNSLFSFSEDGNLLIIAQYDEHNTTEYLFFDTVSGSYWSKKSDAKVVYLGKNKSIEEKFGALTCQAYCVTLVDSNMAQSLQALMPHANVNVTQHPLDTIIPLNHILTKRPGEVISNTYGLSAEMVHLLVSRYVINDPAVVSQHSTKVQRVSFFSWNSIVSKMFSRSGLVAGFVVIAAVAGIGLKKLHYV